MRAVKPSPSLIALKPRQVMLSSNPTMKAQASAPSLTPHQSSLLLLSVAHFLQRKSFSKTLKKFLSEAQIEKNDLTGSSLDLEEMCCKYLAMSDPSSSNLNKGQLHDMQGDENPNSDGQVHNSSTFTKKKKKRGNESSLDNIAGQSEVDDKSANSKKIKEQISQEAVKESATDVMGGLQSNECAKKEKEKKIKLYESHVDTVESNGGSDAGIEGKTKDKKKKKNKLTSDSLVEDAAPVSEDTQLAATTSNANDIPMEDKISKSKKKKKKDDSEDVEKGKAKDDENEISKVDSTVTNDKSSKKRKRLDSEVHDTQPANENAIEDSKRRKTDTTEEQLNSLAGADKHVGKENGNIEKNGKHSEQNGSAQPKKPFQRVNVEEVVFVDSRLEDNSYWAKDGAETGYGAKAQEVLGQVRGRGFRHEKTKKKRGSYRGGQIDFNSHSVKFNYSDDE